MIFNRLFSKQSARASFTPDIPDGERSQLEAEFKACANRQGGSMKNARRAHALAELFQGLSPAGKQVFADLLGGLNEAGQRSTGERYAEIEEAELFGGSESKLAVIDMFETPRRRILFHLGTTKNGHELLAALQVLASSELREDIEDILQQTEWFSAKMMNINYFITMFILFSSCDLSR